MSQVAHRVRRFRNVRRRTAAAPPPYCAVEQLEPRLLLDAACGCEQPVEPIHAAAAVLAEPLAANAPQGERESLPPDGVVDVYSLLVSGSWWPSIDQMVAFYEILTNDHGADPEKITYLVVSDTIPAGYEDIIDAVATPESFLEALSELGGRVDQDDLLIVNIECHGRGYLGYVPEKPRNVAFHGYCDVPPVVSHTDGADQFDFLESEYEMSVFCGGGTQGPGLPPFWDLHAGLGQWLTNWHSTSTLKRWMHLSHYDDVYVEGLGHLSDSDEDIDKFTDYALGDLNQDGRIDAAAGETMDFDGDGLPGYDRHTGVFDEDDWGPIDEFSGDVYRGSHSPLIGIPYRIFDHGLDDHVDIDVYPSEVGPLEVDGTDLDNDGCIDGIDLNDDGDMTDWVALNETVCLWRGEVTDDEVAEAFRPIECGAKVFITNTCYGGGFIDDLSGPDTIVMAGAPEIAGASGGFLPKLLNEALSTYRDEADVDGDGRVSMMEAFNHASLHPHVGCASGMDLFQYDDNGDRVPHEDPLPNGGDGPFGATVFLSGGPLTADAWYSVGEHARGVGEALLEVPDDGGFSEPRLPGVTELRIVFSEPIDPASFPTGSVRIAGNDAAGQPVDLSEIAVATSTLESDTVGVIRFAPALPDAGRYLVRIEGVTDAAGNPLAGDNDRIFTAIVGDAMEDLRVTAVDLSYIWANRVFTIDGVTESQARSDVTCDGRVNAIDLSAAWARRGANMQDVPDPVLAPKLGTASSPTTDDAPAEVVALAAPAGKALADRACGLPKATAAPAPLRLAGDVPAAAPAARPAVSTVPPETGELEVPGEVPAAADADLPALGARRWQAMRNGVSILQAVQPEELT